MKRIFRVVLGLALLPCAVTFPLFALGITDIYEDGSSYPLTIYVASDLSDQISYDQYSQLNWQVNPPGQHLADSGFFASFPDAETPVVYGPDFGSHGGTSVPDTQFPIPWTFISQDNIPSGSGTSTQPWTVTSRVRSAGGEVEVEQMVSYENTQDEMYISWKITNRSGSDLYCRFTHAVAMYMQGDEDGSAYGFYDSSTGGVGGKNQAGNLYEELIPLSTALSPSEYEVNDYGTIWGKIIGDPPGTGQGLNSVVNTDHIPMAAALQWNVFLPASDQAEMNVLWKMGISPPSIPTPTPTPPPVPPAPPGIVITLNSTTLTAGDQFTVDVTVQPVNQRFDAWAVIIGGGKKYSMVLNKPAQLRGGLHPLISGVKKLTSPLSRRLLDMQIPPNVSGSYQVIVGLVPAGEKPSARNAIPGYLAQTPITIQ